MSVIVTCNAGSTNVKLAAYDSTTLERKGHAVIHNLSAEIAEWLCSIGTLGIVAFGHRVVHGGRKYGEPEVITDGVIGDLDKLAALAPLHQPPALKLIHEARGLYPDAPHIACFDTAFHHTMPEIERRFPLPDWYHREGIQRYGFHGLSYQHIAEALPEYAKDKADGAYSWRIWAAVLPPVP